MSVEFAPETPQSREEKTFALICKIDEVEKENKALKETLEKTTDLVVDYQKRLETAKQSMDELLAVWKDWLSASRSLRRDFLAIRHILLRLSRSIRCLRLT